MGKNFASQEIADSLGEHLYDNINTTWCLKIIDNEVVNFGAIIEKPKFILFNYAYTSPEFRGKGFYTQNILAREEYLRYNKCSKEIRALCTDMSINIMKKLGYIEKSKRGKYTWVRKML
ncbi:MAG: hypothetical protein PHG08_00550 [Bacilli bacterium]|nr:hypothetical protein [Bacilli bacterium]